MLKLKELRLDRHLTQEELGKMLCVNNYIIGNWEQGRTEPCLEDLVKLADVLAITTDFLLGRTDDATDMIEIKTTLSENEQRIISKYNLLNKVAKEKAIAYIDGLTDSSTDEK